MPNIRMYDGTDCLCCFVLNERLSCLTNGLLFQTNRAHLRPPPLKSCQHAADIGASHNRHTTHILQVRLGSEEYCPIRLLIQGSSRGPAWERALVFGAAACCQDPDDDKSHDRRSASSMYYYYYHYYYYCCYYYYC